MTALLLCGGAAATDYCIDPATGSDTASGRCADQAWATLGPSQSFPFVAGDRVLLSAGTHVHPLTQWYMKPGVSWIGAGRDRTTVIYNKSVAVPFVRFRTGTAGSGPPGDLRPQAFTAATVFSDMTLLNQGTATVGIDVACTSGDSAPTIARVAISGFASGINVHPSSDERVAASTHAVLTNSIIRGASATGLAFFADVFYPRAVTEASSATNVSVQVAGVGATAKTQLQDMRDAGNAAASPTLTNCTLAGAGEAALLLVSYYDNGTGPVREQRNAGSTAATLRGSIVTASAGHGVREHSPFTEPASVVNNSMGGNALGDYLDEGTTVRAASAVGTGNQSFVPVFVDAAGGDLHQMAASQTIDRLTASSAPADDVDGQPRPQGGLSDMGADEWIPCTATADASASRQALPCTGGTSTLDASRSSIDSACAGGPLYEWFLGTTRIGTGPTLDVSPTVATTYRLRVRCADPALSACYGETTITIQPSTRPPTADAGADARACAAAGDVVVFDLAGTASAQAPSVLTGTLWTTTAGTLANPSSLTTTLTLTGAAVPQTVTATLTATDDAGCTAQDQVVLTVSPNPSVSIVAPAVECHDPTAAQVVVGVVANDAGGTGAISHAWTSSEGTITGDASALLTLPGSATSRSVDVSVTATDAEGCTATDTTTIRVVPNPVANAGPDGTACGDTGATVPAPLDGSASSGEAPLSFRWSAPEGTIADPSAPVTSIGLSVGAAPRDVVVTLTVTDASGTCVSSDQRTITVGPGPTARAGADTDDCRSPGTATFALDGSASTGQAPLTFAWSASEGTIASPSSAATSIDIAVGAVPKTVVVTLEVRDARGTCAASDQRLITVGPGPLADAGADTSGCFAPGTAVIDLDGSASSGQPPLTYRWTATSGRIASPSSATTTIDIDVGSTTTVVTATLEVSDARGTCAGTDTREIRVAPRAAASPGGPYSAVQGAGDTRLPLDGGSASGEAPLSWAWTTDLGTFEDTGTTTSSLPSPVVLVPPQPVVLRGQACLTVTSAGGCVAGPECTDLVALLTPVNPPHDVSPTLRVVKAPPDGVELRWQDAPTDATHDAADWYDVTIGDTGCGPFARLQRLVAAAGLNTATDPILATPPRFRCYVVRSVNDGGASLPAPPDGTQCR